METILLELKRKSINYKFCYVPYGYYYKTISNDGELGYTHVVDIYNLPDTHKYISIYFKSDEEWYNNQKKNIELLQHTLGCNEVYKFEKFTIINTKQETYLVKYGIYKKSGYDDFYNSVKDLNGFQSNKNFIKMAKIIEDYNEFIEYKLVDESDNENLIDTTEETHNRNIPISKWGFMINVLLSDIGRNLPILDIIVESLPNLNPIYCTVCSEDLQNGVCIKCKTMKEKFHLKYPNSCLGDHAFRLYCCLCKSETNFGYVNNHDLGFKCELCR